MEYLTIIRQALPVAFCQRQLSVLASRCVPLLGAAGVALSAFIALGALCLYQFKKMNAEIKRLQDSLDEATKRSQDAAITALENLNKTIADKERAEAERDTARQLAKAAGRNLISIEAEKQQAVAEKEKAEHYAKIAVTNAVEALQKASTDQQELRIIIQSLEEQLAEGCLIEVEAITDYFTASESRREEAEKCQSQQDLEASINEQLGQGKVKIVSIKKNKDLRIAYYTTTTPAAEKELREEVQKAQEILRTLQSKHSQAEFHLAVDLQEAQRPIKDAQGVALYTVECKRADTDLEKYLKDPNIPYITRMQICLQVLQGLTYLQETGYVQGDLKPENILVFGKETESPQVRIADFGKAVKVKDEQSLSMRGNPRFSPPEFQSSQKGEVFSAALVIMRLLEEPVLQNGVLIPVLEKKEEANQQRRGIEKYLVEHPDCMQFDQWLSLSGITAAAKLLSPWGRSPSAAAEKAVHDYIDRLTAALQDNTHLPLAQAKQLNALLRRMTMNDSKQRPSMEEALETFHQVLPSLPIAPSASKLPDSL